MLLHSATRFVKRSGKLLAGLLAASMMLTACNSLQLPFGNSGTNPAPTVEHKQIKFNEITYTRPDVDKLYAMIDEAMANAKAGGKQEETLKLYDEILEEIVNYDNMQGVASLHHDIDLSDETYDTESTFLDQEYTKLDNRMLELTGAILASAYADAAKKAWGQDFIDRYEINNKLNSKEIEALSDQETELINEYKKLSAKEYTTSWNGEEVTINDLDFSDPEVATPYYEIYEKSNRELGEIYRELVALRVEIAKKLGFESYTDYAYATLGRDYTKEDARAFGEKVKKNLAPLAMAIAQIYGQEIAAAEERMTVSFEDGIPTLQESLKKGYPAEMSKALEYMLENEMFHFSSEENTSHGGYTTVISGYRAPFMFINTSDYKDPSTVFHEFGHYYNFYLMDVPMWNDGNNLDMAEIHSQGLEVLMHDVYPQLYGDDAKLHAYSSLYALLNSVLQGCVEDEFQQQVFENPTMSLDEMNLVHAKISQEYLGYPIMYEWVDIHHHYETPFYYISYATSAISALEIWEIASQDRSKAMGIYDKITQYTLNAEYRDSLKKSGLSDPFTSKCTEQISAALVKEMKLSA